MFFFGILSTHLPYLILGGLYLVSFGFFSAKALEEYSQKAIENEKVIEFNPNISSSLVNTYDFYYKTKQSQTIAEALSNTQITTCFTKCCIEIPLPSGSGYRNQAHLFSQFSRPPPALFI